MAHRFLAMRVPIMKLVSEKPGDMTGEGGKCFFKHKKARGMLGLKLGNFVNSEPTLKCVFPAVGLHVLSRRSAANQ